MQALERARVGQWWQTLLRTPCTHRFHPLPDSGGHASPEEPREEDFSLLDIITCLAANNFNNVKNFPYITASLY